MATANHFQPQNYKKYRFDFTNFGLKWLGRIDETCLQFELIEV